MAYDQVKQYNEDDAHTTGDKGIQMLAVRDDTLNIRSGTENDYEPLHTNADGALWTVDVNSAAIKTAVETIDNAIAGSEMQVDVITSALPSGASTLAEQQSQTTHLATIAGDTTAIETSVQLIDDTVATTAAAITTKGIAISGTDGTNARIIKTDTSGELQVDVLTMPTVTIQDGGGSITVDNAGTFAVQASLNAGTNNIGDVDVLTINGVAPAFGSGVRGATVQRVTIATDDVVPASQSGTWNINNVSGTVSLPTGASTSANQSTIITSVQLLDDSIVADDAAFTPATTKVNMAGFEVDETTTDTLDEGDAGAARIDASRRQLMRIVGATDANRADVDASGHLQVDIAASSVSLTVADGGGSLTVDNNGTFVVQENGAALTALQLIDDTVATTASAIPSKGIAISGTDGTNARVIKTDTSGELQVDVLTMPTVTVTGTVTANLSATDNAVLDNIDLATTSKYITGIGHGVTTVTTAGTDVALAGSTACKKVIIQAQTDNTGVIAVGASGVDATIATGTGIILYPGDALEFDIDNLADVYIDSSVNGEGVRYTYFT